MATIFPQNGHFEQKLFDFVKLCQYISFAQHNSRFLRPNVEQQSYLVLTQN